MRIVNALVLCFVLLCSCRPVGTVTQQDFPGVWFPPEAESMYGESDLDANREWRLCGNGHYIGFSINNMDHRKIKKCKQIENGDTICTYYYWYKIDDAYGNSIPLTAVFNIKYNSQKIVYWCKGQRTIGYP